MTLDKSNCGRPKSPQIPLLGALAKATNTHKGSFSRGPLTLQANLDWIYNYNPLRDKPTYCFPKRKTGAICVVYVYCWVSERKKGYRSPRDYCMFTAWRQCRREREGEPVALLWVESCRHYWCVGEQRNCSVCWI